MEFSLEPREADLLRRILSNALSNLREEIVKTENYDWRQSLHEDEEVIKSLLRRLENVPAGRP